MFVGWVQIKCRPSCRTDSCEKFSSLTLWTQPCFPHELKFCSQESAANCSNYQICKTTKETSLEQNMVLWPINKQIEAKLKKKWKEKDSLRKLSLGAEYLESANDLLFFLHCADGQNWTMFTSRWQSSYRSLRVICWFVLMPPVCLSVAAMLIPYKIHLKAYKLLPAILFHWIGLLETILSLSTFLGSSNISP